MTSAFSGVHILFLPRSAVLEPNLGDAFAQARNLRDSLQILTVGIRIDLKIRLQNLNLLLRKRRPHPLGLLLAVRGVDFAAFVGGGAAAVERLHVVGFAEDSILVHAKFFAV